MTRRLFTVEEANALIPELEMIMGKLQQQGMVLREQVGEIARAAGRGPQRLTAAEIVAARPQLRSLVAEVEALVGEIEGRGGEFKGVELGLVDFPAELDGEVVLLCWQYGEKEIGYYHAVDAGFGGRKPLHPEVQRAKYLQ